MSNLVQSSVPFSSSFDEGFRSKEDLSIIVLQLLCKKTRFDDEVPNLDESAEYEKKYDCIK